MIIGTVCSVCGTRCYATRILLISLSSAAAASLRSVMDTQAELLTEEQLAEYNRPSHIPMGGLLVVIPSLPVTAVVAAG